MLGLQSTIWQQFKQALIQKLSPISMDVYVITNGFDHVQWASKLPPGPARSKARRGNIIRGRHELSRQGRRTKDVHRKNPSYSTGSDATVF